MTRAMQVLVPQTFACDYAADPHPCDRPAIVEASYGAGLTSRYCAHHAKRLGYELPDVLRRRRPSARRVQR